MKRESGFYWISYVGSPYWEPAQYDAEHDEWHLIDYRDGVQPNNPLGGFHIDERRIERIDPFDYKCEPVDNPISSTYDDMVFVYKWEQ